MRRVLIEPPRHLIAWTTECNTTTKPKGILVPDSDKLGPNERWRIFAVGFFVTAPAFWTAGVTGGALVQLLDSAGFIFAQDIPALPAARPVPDLLSGAYNTPWMTFNGGIIGTQLGAALYLNIVNSIASNISAGYAGVRILAQVEQETN